MSVNFSDLFQVAATLETMNNVLHPLRRFLNVTQNYFTLCNSVYFTTVLFYGRALAADRWPPCTGRRALAAVHWPLCTGRRALATLN